MSGSRSYPTLRMKITPLDASTDTPELTSPLSTMSNCSVESAPPKSPSCEMSTDAMFQLVPYDVPWGSHYYKYKVGSLPGPGGSCIFLRTPTPVDKRRTVQACTTCRERKAKCSGERPSCARCVTRGLECEYTPVRPNSPPSDTRRTRETSLPKHQLKDVRRHSDPYPRHHNREAPSILPTMPQSRRSSPSLRHAYLKVETDSIETITLSPAPTSSVSDYSSPSYQSPADLVVKAEDITRRPDLRAESNIGHMCALPEIQISPVSDEVILVPALHAPQPRKLSASTSSVSALEVRAADPNDGTSQLFPSLSATVPSSSTVDPRLLSSEQFPSNPQDYTVASFTAFPTSSHLHYDAGSSKEIPWQYPTGYEDSNFASQRYYCVDLSTYTDQSAYENMYYCQPTTSYPLPAGYSFTVPLGYPTCV